MAWEVTSLQPRSGQVSHQKRALLLKDTLTFKTWVRIRHRAGKQTLLTFTERCTLLQACQWCFFLVQCCSDNEDLFEGYDSIVGDSSFLAKLEGVELQMRQCHDQQTPNVCEDELSDSVLAEDFRDSPPRALPSSQLEFQKAVTTPHRNTSRGANNTSTPDLMNPRPAVNHADLAVNKPPQRPEEAWKIILRKYWLTMQQHPVLSPRWYNKRKLWWLKKWVLPCRPWSPYQLSRTWALFLVSHPKLKTLFWD